jgi:hypothetical protein
MYAYGVNLSKDNGNTWESKNKGFINSDIYSFAYKGNKLFAATEDGIYLSTNNGNYWEKKNSGLSSYQIWKIAIIDNFIYAGTWNDGIYKANISDFENNYIFEKFNNNYLISPNPVTDYLELKITSENENSSISIINNLGKEIYSQLVSTASIKIDTRAFPSGIYNCIVKSGNDVQTERFVVIK